MATVFQQRTLAKNKASSGDQDSGSFTYKGFGSESFNTGYKLYDLDIIKKDLINHFYIRKGEKLENPEFGTIIWDVLYENFTQDIKEKVAKNVEEIINYDPRIQVDTVSVDTTEQGIRIEAIINYLPFNVKEKMKFNFDRDTSSVS